MLNLMPNIRSGNIIVKSLRIVLNYDLTLTFTLILSLDELFLNILVAKRLNKRAKLFFLIVPRRSSRINKDRRTNNSSQHLRLLEFSLIDIKND